MPAVMGVVSECCHGSLLPNWGKREVDTSEMDKCLAKDIKTIF